ncbi:hypothetical protein F4804DRAFT_353048 [Jackrogersella minutella]|nr:hypothetical protein F4804DRAFT_353048 [Jackrogersella minutella]
MTSPAALPPAIAAQNRGPTIIIVNCVVTSLSTLFVIARLYVRIGIIRKFQLDDFFISFSLFCAWFYVACIIASVHYGNGRHVQVLQPDQLSRAVLCALIGFVPGVLSFGIPKLAAITLLTRLLAPSKTHRIFLWVMGITLILVLLIGVIFCFTQCIPSQWGVPTQKACVSPYILVNFSLFGGSYSAFIDLYLAAYPASVLYTLQMNPKKKLALSIALGLGSVACIVAIYKTTRIPDLASDDFTYATSDLTIWTCVEGSCVTIATCIPVLKPLAEIAFGGRAMGGSEECQGQKNSSSSGTGGSSNRNDDHESNWHRRKIKGPYDLETSLETNIDHTNNESRDNIVPSNIPGIPPPPEDGIVRTQSVAILFSEGREEDAEAPLKKYENWN